LRVTGGDELALELLSDLLVAKSDPSTLRKGAEIAKKHLNASELARNLSEAALQISRDHTESD
jgi:hypothetical protein